MVITKDLFPNCDVVTVNTASGGEELLRDNVVPSAFENVEPKDTNQIPIFPEKEKKEHVDDRDVVFFSERLDKRDFKEVLMGCSEVYRYV